MNKHTAGPWEFTASGVEHFYWISQDKPGKRMVEIARVFASTSTIAEAHANAALIASAPELLEACRCVVSWHREHDSGAGELFGQDFVTNCVAAIRNAERGKV